MPNRSRRGFLVISDLHLSEGRHPLTGYLSRHEDFLFGDELCAFLEHHADVEQWPDIAWTLVINGDFMDFLQVVSFPVEEAPSDQTANTLSVTSESDDPPGGRGPKAGPQESARKLHRIAQGHPEVFGALGKFVMAHRLIIISGNHDAEFIFPEVREAFLGELARRSGSAIAELRERVKFRPWFHFESGLYIEHGHQYDPLNSFRTILDPRLPRSARIDPEEQDHLELPIGSLFVRYVFNAVESKSPFADNIKPASKFLLWFLLHQPAQALEFAFTGGRRLAYKVKRWSRKVPRGSYELRDLSHQEELSRMDRALCGTNSSSGQVWAEILHRLQELEETPVLLSTRRVWRAFRALLGPYRSPLLVALILAGTAAGTAATVLPVVALLLPSPVADLLAEATSTVPGWLIESLRWFFLLQITTLLIGLLLLKRPFNAPRNQLRRKAEVIAALTGAEVIIMGHTHDTDLSRVGPSSAYFNSGTWTKVFSPEDRIIREEKELTFVRILESHEGLKAKLMKWEGRLREARMALVFEDSAKRT